MPPLAGVGRTYRAPWETSGGTQPFRWSLAGALPPGLTFEPESGAIAGTPASAALALLTVTATDATGRVAHRELEFRVSSFPGELAISSPVGYWRLSDLSGADASGRGNRLEIGGGSQRRDGLGGRDGALQLAPGASAVAAGLPVTVEFSVELLFEWQKGPGAALARREGWSLVISDDGVLRGTVTTRAGTVTVASLRPVRVGRVTHAVLNCDGRTLGLFLDGDLLGASPVANVMAATGPLTLGPAQADSGVVLFDEVALYDRAVLGAEVADHLAVVADVRSGALAPK
jgi:hypothetical protein